MRHSRDIVQACPGGGPVIPNQSLAVQCLERKIRTQKFRFFLFFFNECLSQNSFFSLLALHSLHQLSFLYYSSFPSYYVDNKDFVFPVLWWFYKLQCHAHIFRYKCWQTPPHALLKIYVCCLYPALFAKCNILQINTDLLPYDISKEGSDALRYSTLNTEPTITIKTFTQNSSLDFFLIFYLL